MLLSADYLLFLQVIEFSELVDARLSYMKAVLNSLLTSSSDDVITEQFSCISGVKKLRMLCEGVRLFLRHFLLKGKESDAEFVRKVEVAEAALNKNAAAMRM